ncbi:17147_t:CDS:2 [Cetraspora pellucida]|uniref:17147_t:CDS:1 n=1 Tax=Cetraspora pellucida TaxID=1433469 RepID=A0A9N9GD10_9GLOM|nr:17147_t:CDS:2 [Cetraspora pellucida]
MIHQNHMINGNLRNGLRKDQDWVVLDRYRIIFSPGPDNGPS